MELREKTCLIAGASGAIGSAVAERFAREGARLALTYHSCRPEALLEALARQGRTVQAFPLNVERWDEVQSVVRRIREDFGAIHVLVNCAGVLGPVGPCHTLPTEEWARAIETNLLGCFYLARAVVPIMVGQGGGRIIHLSGGGAAYGRPYFTAYSASKAAVVRFTESLAGELRECNIQVNAIAPGPVKSRMWEDLRAAGAAAGAAALKELQQMDSGGGIPAERAASLALFLASERSKDLSGRLISSIHDDWEHLEARVPKIMSSEAWTLRRVGLE